jgi:hypothetical protein
MCSRRSSVLVVRPSFMTASPSFESLYWRRATGIHGEHAQALYLQRMLRSKIPQVSPQRVAAEAPLGAKSTIGGTAMNGGRSLAIAHTLHLNPTTVQGNTVVFHPRHAVTSHTHALLPCYLAACAAQSAVHHIACHSNTYSLCLRKPIVFEDQSTAEIVAPMAPHGEQLGIKRSRGWVPLRICSLSYSSRSLCHSHQHFVLAPGKFPAKNGACTHYSHGRRSSTPVISHVLLL